MKRDDTSPIYDICRCKHARYQHIISEPPFGEYINVAICRVDNGRFECLCTSFQRDSSIRYVDMNSDLMIQELA